MDPFQNISKGGTLWPQISVVDPAALIANKPLRVSLNNNVCMHS